MTHESIPEDIRGFIAKYPKMEPIVEALMAYHEGRTITARCPTCEQVLVVTHFPEIGSLWVGCANGCTSYHEHYRPKQVKPTG